MRDEAVVVGGSMAGMMAAAVLSRRFSHVTIIESDDLPEGAAPRKGVPQSFHLHGLLHGGRLVLDETFGNFTDAVLEAGAVPFDPAREQALRLSFGWLRRAPSDLRTVTASRWLIEHVVRTLVREIPNITFRQGRARGLTASGKRITGAIVADDSAGEVAVNADLVVDASGRTSRSPQWLEAFGFTPPEESVVSPFLGYATVRCRVPEDAWPGDYNAVVAPPFPGETRGGFLTQEEDNTVGLSAAGSARDFPPGDKEEFTSFLRTAMTPIFYDVWKRAEPLTDIVTTRTSQNRLRHWNLVAERPEGFLPIGDAVCAFNPVYGQGITVAALQAKALGGALDETDNLSQATRGMFDDVVNISSFAWNTATRSDIEFAGTEMSVVDDGSESAEGDRDFVRAVQILAVRDPYVAVEFNRAIGLMNSAVLDTPEIRRRVQQQASSPLEPLDDPTYPPLWSDAETALSR